MEWNRCHWPSLSRPDQHSAVFIDCYPFGIDEVCLEIFDVLVVQCEAALQHTIRHPPLALQQLPHLDQGLLKGHRLSSFIQLSLIGSAVAARASARKGSR
jgi:hypothetical protein